ncbi:MAG: hypothetical protein ACK50A_15785 [Sphingobacteriaceae bacterium]|jgi:hypothetical protein
MKKILAVSALFLCLGVSAQKGKTFPVITGTFLNGKSTTLPLKNGKETIVAIAFHKGAEDELKKWLNPLYYTFMKKPSKDNKFDMAEVYDVNFVFAPMIAGFKKIADDFKAGTDKEFWPYILDTEKTDIKGIQKQLGITDNKAPYFFVVDKDGKILEVQSGDFSDVKVDALEEAVGGED